MDTQSLAVFIKDGNEAEIDPLLLRGLDINFTFEQGDSLLHRSAQYGHESLTRFLCERKANVNAANQVGCTPLMKAAACNKPGVVRILLDFKANKELLDCSRQTALSIATLKRHQACVNLLYNPTSTTSSQGGGGGPVTSLNRSFLQTSLEADSYKLRDTVNLEDIPTKLHASLANNKEICKLPYEMVASWIPVTSRVAAGTKAGSTLLPSHYFEGTIAYPSLTAQKGFSAGKLVSIKLFDAKSFCNSIYQKVNPVKTEQEINSIAQLGSSQYFVRLVAYAVADNLDNVALVYERAPCGSLGRLIKESWGKKDSHLPWARRISIAVEIASGLNILHLYREKNPLVYRNFTSDKVVLTSDLTPKLICCGLFSDYRGSALSNSSNSSNGSSSSNSSSSSSTTTTTTTTASFYQCPEAFTNTFDVKSDIYAFGVVLLELLSGRYQAEESERLALIIDTSLEADPSQDWPSPLVNQLKKLSGDCVADFKARVALMATCCKRLMIMKNMYYVEPVAVPFIEMFECSICYEETPVKEAVICGGGSIVHRVCSDCFALDVISQIDQGLFTKNGRQIVCSQCNIAKPKIFAPYAEYVVTSKCAGSSDAIGAYIKAREEAVESEMESRKNAEQRQLEIKFEAEKFELRMELEQDITKRLEAAVALHCFKVMNDLIVTKCPHCQLAFADWEHCFAVEHAFEMPGGKGKKKKTLGCKKFFCGWCLAPFADTDACHRHVFNCKESLNRGSVFGRSEEDFKIVEAQMRKKKVVAYLASPDLCLSSKEIEAVTIALRPLLKDIGVDI